MRRLALMVITIIVCTGCKEVNPAYCPNGTNLGGPGCIADPDAQSEPDASGGPCQVSDDCTGTPNTPVCETKQSSHMCVQCTSDEHVLCTGTTPLCKNNYCAACVADDDCGTGGLCLPNGACAAAVNIIHAVAMGGRTAAPCGTTSNPCTLTAALATSDQIRNVIKLDNADPEIYSANGFIVNTDVTLDARNAIIKRSNYGVVLTISQNRTATIFGGRIDGASTSGPPNDGDGILCRSDATLTVDRVSISNMGRSAISASNGCKLTVTRATISYTGQDGQFIPSILAAGASVTLSRSTLFFNKGGGINVTNGTFVIVGNAFSANGDVMSPVGGMSITTTTSGPMNRIEFNTIASNGTMSGQTPGVNCTVGTDPITSAIARNNIIWGNNGNGAPQVGGTCQHAYSNIGPFDIIGGANDGGNNLSIDPMFITPIYDLHLQSTSPMIKVADPMAKLDGIAEKDLDGDLRIAPADIGFDQRPR